jgi:hypothetical protein
MVIQLSLAKLKSDTLKPLIHLVERGMSQYSWLETTTITLTTTEQTQLQWLQTRLAQERTLLMNEATIWARAIYPVLMLAEQQNVQTWADVELSAAYPAFTLSGVADGVLAACVEGELQIPYFVVVEAKRGLEAENPKYQLYGQLLATARLNWHVQPQEPQTVYGCYTIADTWTFVQAQVSQMEAERPTLVVESSRDYLEKVEADAILKILKGIVQRCLERNSVSSERSSCH